MLRLIVFRLQQMKVRVQPINNIIEIYISVFLETKTLENSMHTVEVITNNNDFKTDIFNNYYKPHKLTIFHETYYFNILPINRLNETASTSLTSGFKAIILDPFKRNVKRNEISQSTQIVQNSPQIDHSSDSDTDDAYTVIQEQTSPKIYNLAQQKENNKLKTNNNINQIDKKRTILSDIKVHVSDKSLNLYKKYADEMNIIENKFSNLFSVNDKTKSIEIIEPKVSIESVDIYKSSIDVAFYGPFEPDVKSISVYEEYIRNLSRPVAN
jgi:hypothetical protein